MDRLVIETSQERILSDGVLTGTNNLVQQQNFVEDNGVINNGRIIDDDVGDFSDSGFDRHDDVSFEIYLLKLFQNYI